ncbi:MAG: hypothetical protein IJA10_02565 [Lachnospiraceae bacterium]|nr:hypothetical protein [Lachnospiraceae bacterium]
MNKGEYGYLQKYRKDELKKTLLLGLVILTGALICVAVLKTTKHIIILIPILASLPFAKSLVNWFMVAKYQFVSKEDYEKLKDLLEEDETLLAELTFVTQESMFYLPIIYICEDQIFYIYEKGLTKLTRELINQEVTDLMNRTGYSCNVVLCDDYKDLVEKIKKRIKKKDKDYSKTVSNLSQRFLNQSV